MRVRPRLGIIHRLGQVWGMRHAVLIGWSTGGKSYFGQRACRQKDWTWDTKLL
jgi:hypothetical protein